MEGGTRAIDAGAAEAEDGAAWAEDGGTEAGVGAEAEVSAEAEVGAEASLCCGIEGGLRGWVAAGARLALLWSFRWQRPESLQCLTQSPVMHFMDLTAPRQRGTVHAVPERQPAVHRAV